MLGGDTISPAKIRWFAIRMMLGYLNITNKIPKSQGYFFFVVKKCALNLKRYARDETQVVFLLRFSQKKPIFIGDN